MKLDRSHQTDTVILRSARRRSRRRRLRALSRKIAGNFLVAGFICALLWSVLSASGDVPTFDDEGNPVAPSGREDRLLWASAAAFALGAIARIVGRRRWRASSHRTARDLPASEAMDSGLNIPEGPELPLPRDETGEARSQDRSEESPDITPPPHITQPPQITLQAEVSEPAQIEQQPQDAQNREVARQPQVTPLQPK